jgi:hypothetical protein
MQPTDDFSAPHCILLQHIVPSLTELLEPWNMFNIPSLLPAASESGLGVASGLTEDMFRSLQDNEELAYYLGELENRVAFELRD